MLIHPLPPSILQHQLSQLPLASSQISSQLKKHQVVTQKFLLENIGVGLDFHHMNKKLLKSLEVATQVPEVEFKVQPINVKKDEKKVESQNDGWKTSLKLGILDHLIKVADTLEPEDFQLMSIQISTQLPIPNKTNSPKIVALLEKIFASKLDIKVKEKVLQQSFNVLIQKALKMKLETKAYSTQRALKSNLFDMAQVYQKCYNKTMKILIASAANDEQLRLCCSTLITRVMNCFKANFLSLVNQRNEEKTIHFLFGLREQIQPKETFLTLARLYCEKNLKPQYSLELVGRLSSKSLLGKLQADEIQQYGVAYRNIFENLSELQSQGQTFDEVANYLRQ